MPESATLGERYRSEIHHQDHPREPGDLSRRTERCVDAQEWQPGQASRGCGLRRDIPGTGGQGALVWGKLRRTGSVLPIVRVVFLLWPSAEGVALSVREQDCPQCSAGGASRSRRKRVDHMLRAGQCLRKTTGWDAPPYEMWATANQRRNHHHTALRTYLNNYLK